MKKNLTTALFLIVGLINFAPLVGVLGADLLIGLYKIQVTSPDLLLLLQHRAVLFGIVGGYILISAAKVKLRPSAAIMGFISMSTYILLIFAGGPVNDALMKVAYVDMAAIILLLLALILGRQSQKI